MFKSSKATVLALSIAWCASTLLALLAQRPAFQAARRALHSVRATPRMRSTSDSTPTRFLSADRHADLQIRWTNNLHDRRSRHQLDPEGIPVPEPGSLVRLAQRVKLRCSVPEAAWAKPGRSKMTHEPLSISARLRVTSGLSVFTWISVPAFTVL